LSNGQRQLSNEQFLAKAPAEVIERIRKRAQELDLLIAQARKKLEELK
jgi:valyl-tRNA synthetase